MPLALAVVPGWLRGAAATRIGAYPQAVVVQHGWAHENHAPAGSKKVELGGLVSRTDLLAGLDRGRDHLTGDSIERRFDQHGATPSNQCATRDRLSFVTANAVDVELLRTCGRGEYEKNASRHGEATVRLAAGGGLL